MPRLQLSETVRELPDWIIRLAKFKRKESLDIDYEKHMINEDGVLVDKVTGNPVPDDDDAPTESDIYNANLISSNMTGELHIPILDIDVPVHVGKSSTPEHNHVYILHPLSKEDMAKLIDTLVEVGIMQPGIKKMQWERYGELTVRPPWVKKGDDRSFLEQYQNRLSAAEKRVLKTLRGILETLQASLDENELNDDPSQLSFLPDKGYLLNSIEETKESIKQLEVREG